MLCAGRERAGVLRCEEGVGLAGTDEAGIEEALGLARRRFVREKNRAFPEEIFDYGWSERARCFRGHLSVQEAGFALAETHLCGVEADIDVPVVVRGTEHCALDEGEEAAGGEGLGEEER